MRDPFEAYAMAGAPFGDTEDQKIESLARQAMPQKADEITRLFREGKPDIALLDGLEKTQRWPLLSDVFRTETAAEVVQSHIELYVNAFSRDLGAEGIAAIEAFLSHGRQSGVLPGAVALPVFRSLL